MEQQSEDALQSQDSHRDYSEWWMSQFGDNPHSYEASLDRSLSGVTSARASKRPKSPAS
jgi:hypothetical protein